MGHNQRSNPGGINLLAEDYEGHVWVGSSPSFINEYNPVVKSFRQHEFAHLIDHAANVKLIIATCFCSASN